MDRSSREKISKETEILNDKIEKLDFIDIFRMLHPKSQHIHFFSSAHRTFSMIDHTYWGTKLTSTNSKSIEIIPSTLDHNSMKLEINHRKRNEEKPTTWRLNNNLLKKQMGQ